MRVVNHKVRIVAVRDVLNADVKNGFMMGYERANFILKSYLAYAAQASEWITDPAAMLS